MVMIRAREARGVARNLMMIRRDLRGAEDRGPAVVAVMTAGKVASIPSATSTDATKEDAATHLTAETRVMMRKESSRERRNP